jgi:predicted anti-sigma-YlaC factor YlaD
MNVLTCEETRGYLEAYHDHELAVCDEIAVSHHLEWCRECGYRYDDLRQLQSVLRASVHAAHALTNEESAAFTAGVVSRLTAERNQSILARIRGAFEDMHLVYAGLGAAAATAMCIVVMLGMMRFAAKERPDSLAAIVSILANPGSNANPVGIDARVQMPRALDSSLSDSPADEDAVFALAAVVTREGTLANGTIADLGTLRASGRQGAAKAKAIESLMNAMARARFEPAQMDGLPVAVNMVWLVAHTTVRAKHPIA